MPHKTRRARANSSSKSRQTRRPTHRRPKYKSVNSSDLRAEIYRALNGSSYFRGGLRRDRMYRTLMDAMLYGTKPRKMMHGGMDNGNSNSNSNSNDIGNLMYGYLTPGRLKDVALNSSMIAPDNNTLYKLEPPWPPTSWLVGVDTSGNIVDEREEQHKNKLTSSFKGHVFQIREEFVHNISEKDGETASMVVSIGSSRKPQCLAAALTSTSAKMLSLGSDTDCTEYGELPKEGQGAKMMMRLMQKYLNEKGVVAASLDDNARKNLPKKENGTNKQYSESDFYFLARGELYYHRYGFYPEDDVEQYIRAVIGMKKLAWNDIRESSLQSDVTEKLESIAMSCNSLLMVTDEAMKWFSAVWEKDPSYLNDQLTFIFASIAHVLKINISIQNFWKSTELSMNPRLAERVRQILASYAPEDRKLFYVQPIGRIKCVEDTENEQVRLE